MPTARVLDFNRMNLVEVVAEVFVELVGYVFIDLIKRICRIGRIGVQCGENQYGQGKEAGFIHGVVIL